MIDILVYLVENYPPDACPEPAALARKLTAAGFGSEDISAALNWLDGFPAGNEASFGADAGRGMRIYDEEEQERLPVQCRGFLGFLERHRAIDARLREAIIERALALPEPEIDLERLKVIVLAVIWRCRHEIDALILEELLADGDDGDETPDAAPTGTLLN